MAGDKSSTQTEVEDKIAFAKGQHAAALTVMQEWEDLYKGAYEVPKDVSDNKISVFKPAKPRAIVQKALSMLRLRARVQNQVLPKSDATTEEAICTKLEQYLEGYQFGQRRQTGKSALRDNVEWGLLRGKAVLIAQYVPRFVGTEFFPIRSLAPDPMTVYEVEGDNGIMYFARETTRYVMELGREIKHKQGWGENKEKWITPKTLDAKKSTETVNVKEYWDGEYYCVIADDEMILPPTEHGYGFCPISIAHVNPTPFPEYEWRGRSILADAMDALKNQAILVAKLGDGVSSYFYPLVFWATNDGRGGWVNPYAANVSVIPPDAKMQIYNPQPNIPIVEAYNRWLQGEINISTFPEIAWGMDVQTNANSGFAISQVLGQVMDRLQDMKEEFEVQNGEHFGQVLRLTQTFSTRDEAKGGFEVMANAPGKNIQTRRIMVKVGEKDVGDHTYVVTSITPTLPTEKLALMQQMQGLREPNKTSGLPLMDDKSIREGFPEIFESPDETNERVDEEYWRKKVPEIEQWEQDEYMEGWKKGHKPHLPLDLDESKLSKAELVQRLKLLEMMVKNPQAFMQALAQSGPPPTPGMPGQPGAMPQGAPPGMPSQMLPPQMQSGNANPLQGQTPEGLVAQQMTRGPMP